ncbi:MAG TPA: cyclic nucleotide-binding domain-containing protein, partial [Polyangiales bacterium]|nr:cyclic nucleotide-binding domain-containing protein [Polyangiales bacterium]
IAVSAGSLVRKFIALHGDRLQSMRPRSQSMRPDSYAPGASGRQIVQEILRSTLLRRFALVQVATAFASTLLKFELESTLQTTLGIDHIAAFLGMLNLCANGAVLAVQTLLESRLLRAFGLTLGLALAGAILALGGSVLLFASGLWIVAMLRFAEIVARFSVTRTAEDLVLLPVPSEQRRRARAFITTLVMPSSVLLSSLFIALLAHAPSLARNLFMLASGATAAGLGLALRKPYRERLRDSLKRRRITLDPLGKSVHDQTLAALLASLPGAEPSLRLGVLRTLARHRLEGAEIALGGVNVVREIEIEMQHAQRLRWLRHALPRAKLDPRHEHAALREVEHQHERAYEAIFLMLMLLHSPADLQRAYLSIVRGERRERAFAIEMLGHTVPPPLGKQLVSFLSAARSADELIQAQRALGASRDLSLRSAFGEPIPERLRKLALYLSVASPRPEEEPLMAGLQNVFALRSVELFSRLSPEELQSVADIASHHQVPESHVLFREGEPGTSFYVVLRGQLRVERDGKLVAELKDGECFGELALLDKGLRSATVTSITACDLLRIVDEDFRELLERYPSIAIHMLAILARRTTDLLQRS